MHRVPPHRGSQWIADGWALFRRHPSVWIALGVIDVVGYILLASLPFINNLAPVFAVLFAGGMTAAADECRRTGSVRIADALHGIRRHLRALLLMSLVGLIAGLICDFAAVQMSASLQTPVIGGGAATPWLAALLYAVTATLAATLAAAALWLGPSLVVLRETEPAAALKASLVAIRRNSGAALIYGLFAAGLLGAALLTLGIALFVVLPLLYLSTYAACRDLFDH